MFLYCIKRLGPGQWDGMGILQPGAPLRRLEQARFGPVDVRASIIRL